MRLTQVCPNDRCRWIEDAQFQVAVDAAQRRRWLLNQILVPDLAQPVRRGTLLGQQD